jgi:NADH-quinone oxidoreductase subunit N
MLSDTTYIESLFSTLTINILIYLITLFLFFTAFNAVPNNKLKYLNFIGVFSTFAPLKFFLIVAFFSLCGVPPLAGFFAKLYILMSLLNRSAYFLIVLFFFFNLFAMFFYLQNIRFLTNSSKAKVFQVAKVVYTGGDFFQTSLVLFFFFIIFAYIYINNIYTMFICFVI